MPEISATQSGQFTIGGEITVHRLGFGAMRLTGSGIWGEPADPAECVRTLERVPELGINLIDTAASYGPAVSELLIRKALHPYQGLLIATKGGLARTGPDQWIPIGRPEFLIENVRMSCRRLGLEQIALWQLHRIDPKVPREEQFDCIRDMKRQGWIRHVGLSQVGVEDIEVAQKYFDVVTVQNLYNLVDRSSEDVLMHCETRGIGFIPWFPLGAGELARPGSILDEIARKYGATPSQIALAWMLRRSPNMLPIPGTSKVRHLEENTAAAGIKLADADFRKLDDQGRDASRRQVA